jgi:signal recognition particle receptor subunit beta
MPEDVAATPAGDERAQPAAPDDPAAETPDPLGVPSLPAQPGIAQLSEMLSDPTPTLLLSLLLPVLIAVFLLFGRRGGARRGARLVLFGPVGGGKSALYHRLKHGRVIPTVSSMEPASSSFVLKAPEGGAPTAPVHVSDVPGSGRLRERLKDEAGTAAALVCVLDGTSMASQAREAAGMLFDVYAHESVARRPPPLLVALNKCDLAGSAAASATKTALETEVQRVRVARTSMADTSGSSKQARAPPGPPRARRARRVPSAPRSSL